MSNFQKTDFGKMPDWQRSAAFNTYWQYSYVNRSAFYANIRGEYQQYMRRWVQNYLWWYDGWVPYFHDGEQGIFSTRLATSLVNGIAKKVIGGRLFFKNANSETENSGEGYAVNEALAFVDTKWAPASGFDREAKKAIVFAAAAGTSLLKLDKVNGNLKVKALRFDSFYPTVGADNKVLDVVCYIRDFTKIADVGGKTSDFDNFYVVEHRYFADYTRIDGTIKTNAPVVEYCIKRSSGTVTNGMDYSTIRGGEDIKFRDLPKSIRPRVAKAFPNIIFDRPIILPFDDHLGVELVNWTDCVSAIPELPFGDSFLVNIMPYLQSYDYYFSAFNTDMYIGRGRVLLPAYMTKDKRDGYNSGIDSMLFTKIEVPGGGEEIKPTPVQFDLRSTSWTEIRTMIIQNIALGTGVNLATIASFLQDTNAARTAREISTEESETALFVEDKREILERPINRILKLVTLFYHYSDDVVLRWSAAGLTNIYARTEMLATAVNAGFCSKKKAIRMFDQDSDEYQLQEEYNEIEKDNSFGGVNDSIYPAQYAGDSLRRGGNGNTDPDARRILDADAEDDTRTENAGDNSSGGTEDNNPGIEDSRDKEPA